jgi:hypothetical protein
MGQTVFVLSTLIGNEQRPSAVVTSEYSADQWVKSGNDNDWISFELDDLSLTGMADKGVTTFKPKPMPKIDDAEKMRRDTIKTLQDSNAQLQKTVESLIEKVKQLQGKKGASGNPLLKKAMYEYYHVTDRASADSILKNGFDGGWGDLGYGVYLWNGLDTAEDYAAKGGWDHALKDSVILAVSDPEIVEITGADLDPNWDPEQYVDMYWHPMDEGAGNWKPQSLREVK